MSIHITTRQIKDLISTIPDRELDQEVILWSVIDGEQQAVAIEDIFIFDAANNAWSFHMRQDGYEDAEE